MLNDVSCGCSIRTRTRRGTSSYWALVFTVAYPFRESPTNQAYHYTQAKRKCCFTRAEAKFICALVHRYWFTTYQATNSAGLIATKDVDANNILNAIFSTGAAVALIVTLLLDNTIPGTK